MQGASRSGSLLLLLLFGALALARADEVILTNGRALQGRIISEDDQQVVIETKAGRVAIQRERVKEVVRSQAPPQPEAPAPVTTPPEASPAATQRVLLLFSFDGADQRLLGQVARRVGVALGGRARVELLDGRPKPDERDAIDRRAQQLLEMARQLRLDEGGTLQELEARIRAALKADPRPEVREYEAIVDDVCRPRLSVTRLEAQAVALAAERLEPSVIGVIGVTNRDMSTPELNFLFGHADVAARAGVVSYLRFMAGSPAADVAARRAAVQVLSTCGVLLGLGRCQQDTCARAYPRTLEEHDRKQAQFCADCRRVVDAALAPR